MFSFEDLGFEETDEDLFRVYFRDIAIGELNVPELRFTQVRGLPKVWVTTTSILSGATAALSGRVQGQGNDRVWKAWRAMKLASHPSHTLWKSPRDYHIPTASATGYVFSKENKNSFNEGQTAARSCNGFPRSKT